MSAQHAKILLDYVLSGNTCLLIVALVLMIRSGVHRQMPAMAALLGACALQYGVDSAVMFHRHALGLSSALACYIFFYNGWVGQISTSLLTVFSIYGIYQALMKPLPGIQRVGTIVFRGAGAFALCFAALMVFGPHANGSTSYLTFCSQFEEAGAVLSLCLLLLVTFATRPLGLSYSSRFFGAALGMGVIAAATLVESAWITTVQSQSPYSPVQLIGGFACFTAVCVWMVYFAKPEPVRRIITLPTTSPFFFWNRIAEALGDAPGEVAVAGITPDMFAPAELMAFRARPAQAPVIEMPHIAQR